MTASDTLTLRANFAIYMLYAAMITDIIGIATGLSQHSLWQNMTPEQLTQTQQPKSDNAVLSFISLLIAIMTAIGFIRWFKLVHQNVKQMGVEGLRFSPNWAMFGFFIPFLSLFIPYMVAKEVWQASHTTSPTKREDWSKEPTPVIIKAWWGFFICTAITGMMAAQVLANATTIEHVLQALEGIILGNALSIIGAYFAIQMIKLISEEQQQKLKNESDTQFLA